MCGKLSSRLIETLLFIHFVYWRSTNGEQQIKPSGFLIYLWRSFLSFFTSHFHFVISRFFLLLLLRLPSYCATLVSLPYAECAFRMSLLTHMHRKCMSKACEFEFFLFVVSHLTILMYLFLYFLYSFTFHILFCHRLCFAIAFHLLLPNGIGNNNHRNEWNKWSFIIRNLFFTETVKNEPKIIR